MTRVVKIPIADFNIKSEYTCTSKRYTEYSDDTHTTEVRYYTRTTASTPSTGTSKKTFDLSTLPKRATIKSAKVCIDSVSTTYGANVSEINGVSIGNMVPVSVDVSIESGATSLEVSFVFQSSAPTHDHATLNDGVWGSSYWEGLTLVNEVTKDHEGYIYYSGVYLLIEYDQTGRIYHAEGGQLIPYTLYRAEGGQLVPYSFMGAGTTTGGGTTGDQLVTSDGYTLLTSDNKKLITKGG